MVECKFLSAPPKPSGRRGRRNCSLNKRTVSVLAVAGCLAVLQIPTLAWAAAADNILPTSRFSGCREGGPNNDSGGAPCLTDNEQVSWWAEGSIDKTTSPSDTSAEAQINAAMDRSYDPTDLNTYYDTSFKDSGSGETDIVYRADSSKFKDRDVVGFYFCDDAVGSECDQGYVTFKSASYSTTFMRALVCHETGHAVGLLHPNDGTPSNAQKDSRFECMMNEIDVNHYGLGADPNVANINSVY